MDSPGVSLTQLITIMGIATSLIMGFLGWLHLRVNEVRSDMKKESDAISDQVKTDVDKLTGALLQIHRDRETARTELLTFIATTYVPHSEMGARLDGIKESVVNLSLRISEFLTLQRDMMQKGDRTADRVSTLEGQLK